MAGMPWVTRLPHVVHVVECVETYDYIGLNRAVTRYTYHHGYFDGYERRVSGFGRVDQWDTEEYRDDTNFPEGCALNWDAASWVSPGTHGRGSTRGRRAGHRGFAPVRERILECAFPSRSVGVTG